MSHQIEIIIVNYRAAELLTALLDKLSAGHHERVRVTIWDNDSGRDDVAELEAYTARHTWMRLIVSQENLGFGEAVNRAVSSTCASPEDVIWILNPDTLVESAIISPLADELERGFCDVISPLILSGADPKVPTVWFAGGTLNSRTGINTHSAIGASPSTFVGQEPIPTSFMTGAAPLMKMSTWQKVGGFRGDLFLYWEDCEWSERANALGLKMFVHPGFQIWHAEGGSSGGGAGLSKRFYYYVARNRLSAAPTIRLRFGRAFGAGMMGTTKLVFRPLVREHEGRFSKFVASMTGTAHGLMGITGPVKL